MKCNLLVCVVDAYSYLTFSLKPLLSHCLHFLLFFPLLTLSLPCISTFLLPQGNYQHHPFYFISHFSPFFCVFVFTHHIIRYPHKPFSLQLVLPCLIGRLPCFYSMLFLSLVSCFPPLLFPH